MRSTNVNSHTKTRQSRRSRLLSQQPSANSGRFGLLRKRSIIFLAGIAAIVACTPGAAGLDSDETLKAYGIDPELVEQFIENGGTLPEGFEAKLVMLTRSQKTSDLETKLNTDTQNDDAGFTMPKGVVQADTDFEALTRVAADLGILSDAAMQTFVMASVQPTPTAPALATAAGPPGGGLVTGFDSASTLTVSSDTAAHTPAGSIAAGLTSRIRLMDALCQLADAQSNL